MGALLVTSSIVVLAESLAVGDIILPGGSGVLWVAPEFPRGVRLVTAGARRVERVVPRRKKYRIATRLPTPSPSMHLYRRPVGRRCVAWYPAFSKEGK